VLHDLATSAGGWIYRKRVSLFLLGISGVSGYLAASPYSQRPEVAAIQTVLKGLAALVGAS
jgi:hypothetical protein